jgi:hypothetical protein
MMLSIIFGRKGDTVIGVISDGVFHEILCCDGLLHEDFPENRYIRKQKNLPVSAGVVVRKNLHTFYVSFLTNSD